VTELWSSNGCTKEAADRYVLIDAPDMPGYLDYDTLTAFASDTKLHVAIAADDPYNIIYRLSTATDYLQQLQQWHCRPVEGYCPHLSMVISVGCTSGLGALGRSWQTCGVLGSK
jgi:hypothetical protein